MVICWWYVCVKVFLTVKFLINHKGLIIPVFLLESWEGNKIKQTNKQKRSLSIFSLW